jgi:hypothetical protein
VPTEKPDKVPEVLAARNLMEVWEGQQTVKAPQAPQVTGVSEALEGMVHCTVVAVVAVATTAVAAVAQMQIRAALMPVVVEAVLLTLTQL